MSSITNIVKNRAPVRYSVHIDHYFTGEIGLSIEGVGENPDQRSKDAIVAALRNVIKLIEGGKSEEVTTSGESLAATAPTQGADDAQSVASDEGGFQKWASDPLRADKIPLENHQNGAYKYIQHYLIDYGWKSALKFTIRDAAPEFQQRVHLWMMPCFGAEIAGDTVERNHRFYEESTEYVQSKGMTSSECHQLVDYVFGRPIGNPFQEAGGVLVTFAAACNAAQIDMNAAGETELARISDPETMAKIRAKQAAKPKHSPLPEHVVATPRNAEPPIGHFLFDQQAETWHQVDADYENDPDVVPLYAPAGWKP